jgi:D-alanyl-lipoteichoic acid acyltransferase DltB (MBOAT superfamily)
MTESWIAGFLIYLALSWLAMRLLTGQRRETLLAVCNVGGVFWCLFYATIQRYSVLRFATYFVLVLFQFAMLHFFVHRKSWSWWLAFYPPIAVLIFVRYVPLPFLMGFLKNFGLVWRGNQQSLSLVGISYLAFRCSRLTLEIRNGSVQKPGLREYLNFAFFLPTMNVGPINTYALYRSGFGPVPYAVPAGRAALRVLVGLVKYYFIGGVIGQLTYDGFLLNEHPHHWIDLPIAMVFYYLFLYCNFSGFCDMAIGTAAFLGIPVPENFNNPFAARNVKDFWNRWHITLSVWMRDIVFTPLSKYLVAVTGPRFVNHAMAIAIAVVFLLVGIWHGVGWNYVLFGLAHSVALVANHYYTIFLKKRLGRDGFKSYMANPWIHGISVVMTFCYCAAALFLFANTVPQMKEIIDSLR